MSELEKMKRIPIVKPPADLNAGYHDHPLLWLLLSVLLLLVMVYITAVVHDLTCSNADCVMGGE